jgi:hypothetical protein
VAFPTDPLAVKVELQLAGTWTDITSDVLLRDRIQIDRGRADESARPDPGKCRLTVNNGSGKYSPRVATGPYYGLIGRNTPIRVSVPGTAGHLDITGDGGRATTPDTAVLDITGDIDIRAEVTLDDWFSSDIVVLAAKFDSTTNNRSWILTTSNTGLILQWSPDGITGANAGSDPIPVIPPSGRLAVRAVLDVNNGLGGWTATFYTAASIAGPWTQLGNPTVTTSGATSIFASAAVLGVGDAATLTNNLPPMPGQVHAFELRNGIAGAVVANPAFTAQADGAASFTDGAGRTWTVAGAASISTRAVRFRGEVSAWPTRWDVSGRDVYGPLEAAGPKRRMSQGKSPIGSTLRVQFSGETSNPVLAYWPCEDAEGATSIGAAISGVQSMTITGAPRLAAFDAFPCSDPIPVLGTTGVLTGQVPAHTAPTATMVRFLMALPAAGATAGTTMCQISCSGTVHTVELYYDATAGGGIAVRARNTAGSIVADTGLGTSPAGLNGALAFVSIEMVQNGGNVDIRAYVIRVGDTLLAGTALISPAGTYGTVGTVGLGGASADTAIGHVAVQTATAAPTDTFEFIAPLDAYNGETTGARLLRLADTAGVPISVTGEVAAWALLGRQKSATVLDLLGEAADADMGILGESRTTGGLHYRDRASLYNQTAALALNYASNGEVAPPLEPTPDDQNIRNDREVKRADGSSTRAVLAEGTLSVQDPPNGVGRYNDTVTLSLYADGQLADIAGWRLRLGTWDEDRYPHLSVDLAAAPHLITAALALDCGDRITISNPPAWLPPDLISQIAQGYTERLGSYDWDLTFNTTPAGPWQVAVLDDATLGRLDTDGSTLVAAVTSSATTLTVQTTGADSPRWTTDPTDVPFDLRIAGETVTATAVNHAIRDAFGRTVSNGWGTADSGQTWATSGGAAADYSVASGVGRHSHTSVAVARHTVAASPSANVDLYATVATAALATGASHNASLLARYSSASDLYQCRLEFTTTQACNLTLRKTVAGADSQLATLTVPGLTHAAGTRFALRFQVFGSTLRAKAWLASGTEPKDWQITATDTAQTAAGSIGCRSVLSTGNTNALPLVIDFDDVRLLNPQAVTVTRAVNGVSKAQAAGADVRLATPMILAL